MKHEEGKALTVVKHSSLKNVDAGDIATDLMLNKAGDTQGLIILAKLAKKYGNNLLII